MHDVQDQFFDLVGLDFCLGEELGWAQLELRHFVVGDLAAGVDDQGQGPEVGLLAESVCELEAIAIGQG